MNLQKTTGKFALIAHPPDKEIFRDYIKFLKPDKDYKDELLIKLFEWAPPYVVQNWNNVSFDNKTFVDGILIMVPFLPEMKDINFGEVEKKIEKAIELASREKCTVAALGAYTSIVMQGREKELEEKYNMKITSGNTNTAALICSSIEDICSQKNVDLKNSTLAIIGASGDIGQGCVQYFKTKVKKLILTARGTKYLSEIMEKQLSDYTCEIELTNNNFQAISQAEIVICATSSYRYLFKGTDFNPETIVCDASVPFNVDPNSNCPDNIYLYHGGIAKLPFNFNINFNIGLKSKQELYGCMVEGILISMDKSLKSSHNRGNINLKSIKSYQNKFSGILKPSFPFTP